MKCGMLSCLKSYLAVLFFCQIKCLESPLIIAIIFQCEQINDKNYWKGQETQNDTQETHV